MGKKLSNILYHIAMAVSVATLLIMLVLLMVVVIGRYFLGFVPAWSEEIALVSMSWLGLMSAALMEHDKAHIRVSIIDNIYPKVLLCICSTIRYFMKLFLCISMAYFGCIIAATNKGYLASIPVSAGINYWPGAVAGGFMALFLLLRIKEELIDIWHTKEGDGGGGTI